MGLWSIGYSAHEVAAKIAEGDLTGQVFRLLLAKKIARPPRERKAANMAAPLGGLNGYSLPAESALSIIGVSLADLHYQHCRWPLGDPQSDYFRFCGKQKGNKSRYCEEHHAIAYRPAEEIHWEE